MKNSLNSNLIKAIAAPPLFLYKTINLIRRFFYSHGILKSYSSNVPVISIGNTVMGGGGKTPMVVWLAEQLSEHKKTCVIITRGYGRRDENEEVIIPPGTDRHPDPNITGDEPAMIARILPYVPIICCAERKKAAECALENFKPDFIIMDDGFQHLKMKRDLNIVLIPQKQTSWKREFDFIYKRADILVRTGDYIPKCISDDSSLIKADRCTGDPINIRTGKKMSYKEMKNKKAVIAAGIAAPKPFIDSLGMKGIRISDAFIFPDHYRYKNEDIRKIQNLYPGKTLILTTFKDAVKIEHLCVDAGRWYYIPHYLKLDDGREIIKQVLSLSKKKAD